MRMHLILLKSVAILRPFLRMENNVKPGESERLSEGTTRTCLRTRTLTVCWMFRRRREQIEQGT